MRDGGNGLLAKRLQTKKLQSGSAKDLRSARPAKQQVFRFAQADKAKQVTNLYLLSPS